MTTALLIPAQGETRIITLPSENAHTDIHDYVGGWFGCVEIGGSVAMYVHDEGLLIGLEPNATATALYGAPIAGDVVLVGSLNAKGGYDGETYDIPDFLNDPQFMNKATLINNTESFRTVIAETIATMDLTPQFVPMNDAQFDAWLGGN